APALDLVARRTRGEEDQRGRVHQLHDVDDNIGKSRKIMGAMVRRMDRNKWIIGLLIALLVLAILVVLYFKFVH
uniref:Uncharacterized protein n=1 Tax=Aegilops tauschii subsp. strangulata TaxID=200361 RepID=A0A453EXQ6_AEGTS